MPNIGINRMDDDNKIRITLPIFHAFGTLSEMEGKVKKSQKDLLSQQIDKREYKDLDEKKEDVLWIGDVAALITSINNMLVSTKIQQTVFSTNETLLLLVTILTISLSCDETYRMRKVIRLLGSQVIIGNGQWFLREVGILKQLRIMKRC